MTPPKPARSALLRWLEAFVLCGPRRHRTEREKVNKTVFMLFFLSLLFLVSVREDAMALPRSAYINAVDLDIVPSERERFLAAIAEDAAATIKEPGCLQFDVLMLANDPNHLFLYEVYESEAAFRAHRESEQFKKYAATTANMVAKRVTRAMTAISIGQKPQ
jgi:quinol monooxygenase YgiN